MNFITKSKNNIKYEWEYIITNCFMNKNKIITLIKYSKVEYIGNIFDIFCKVINKNNNNLSKYMLYEIKWYFIQINSNKFKQIIIIYLIK